MYCIEECIEELSVILLGHFGAPILTWRPGNYATLAHPRR